MSPPSVGTYCQLDERGYIRTTVAALAALATGPSRIRGTDGDDADEWRVLSWDERRHGEDEHGEGRQRARHQPEFYRVCF